MQIFSPVADTWLRLGVGVAAVVTLVLCLVATGIIDPTYASDVGWTVDQPVPFSHEHHVGELGIDCRYCHSSVETVADAGLPATHVCMTCHSQIWTGARMLAPVRHSYESGRPIHWNRVTQLPDYVYFNHAIHIDRGVPCVECHGRVDTMPLTRKAKALHMKFCIDCHRDPVGRLKPPDQVTRMDWSGWSDEEASRYRAQAMRRYHFNKDLTNCGTCHR